MREGCRLTAFDRWLASKPSQLPDHLRPSQKPSLTLRLVLASFTGSRRPWEEKIQLNYVSLGLTGGPENEAPWSFLSNDAQDPSQDSL